MSETDDEPPPCEHATCSGTYVDLFWMEEYKCPCICHGPRLSIWERIRRAFGARA